MMLIKKFINQFREIYSLLKKNTKIIKNKCINIKTGRHVKALIVTHVNGLSCEIDILYKIC